MALHPLTEGRQENTMALEDEATQDASTLCVQHGLHVSPVGFILKGRVRTMYKDSIVGSSREGCPDEPGERKREMTSVCL